MRKFLSFGKGISFTVILALVLSMFIGVASFSFTTANSKVVDAAGNFNMNSATMLDYSNPTHKAYFKDTGAVVEGNTVKYNTNNNSNGSAVEKIDTGAHGVNQWSYFPTKYLQIPEYGAYDLSKMLQDSITTSSMNGGKEVWNNDPNNRFIGYERKGATYMYKNTREGIGYNSASYDAYGETNRGKGIFFRKYSKDEAPNGEQPQHQRSRFKTAIYYNVALPENAISNGNVKMSIDLDTSIYITQKAVKSGAFSYNYYRDSLQMGVAVFAVNGSNATGINAPFSMDNDEGTNTIGFDHTDSTTPEWVVENKGLTDAVKMNGATQIYNHCLVYKKGDEHGASQHSLPDNTFTVPNGTRYLRVCICYENEAEWKDTSNSWFENKWGIEFSLTNLKFKLWDDNNYDMNECDPWWDLTSQSTGTVNSGTNRKYTVPENNENNGLDNSNYTNERYIDIHYGAPNGILTRKDFWDRDNGLELKYINPKTGKIEAKTIGSLKKLGTDTITDDDWIYVVEDSLAPLARTKNKMFNLDGNIVARPQLNARICVRVPHMNVGRAISFNANGTTKSIQFKYYDFQMRDGDVNDIDGQTHRLSTLPIDSLGPKISDVTMVQQHMNDATISFTAVDDRGIKSCRITGPNSFDENLGNSGNYSQKVTVNGDYTISVTDNTNNTSTKVFNVNMDVSKPTVTLTSVEYIGNSNNSAKITVDVQDETKDGLTIVYTGGGYTNVPFSGNSVQVQKNGTYSVVAKDKWGYESDPLEVVVNCIKIEARLSYKVQNNIATVTAQIMELNGTTVQSVNITGKKGYTSAMQVGNNENLYTAEVTDNDTYTVDITGANGEVTSIKTTVNGIDKIGPTIMLKYDFETYKLATAKDGKTIKVLVEDDQNNISRVVYKYGEDSQTIVVPVDKETPGLYLLQAFKPGKYLVTAYDTYENASTPYEINVTNIIGAGENVEVIIADTNRINVTVTSSSFDNQITGINYTTSDLNSEVLENYNYGIKASYDITCGAPQNYDYSQTITANYAKPKFNVRINGVADPKVDFKTAYEVSDARANEHAGETFIGWFNADGICVNTNPVFTMIVTNNISLTSRYQKVEPNNKLVIYQNLARNVIGQGTVANDTALESILNTVPGNVNVIRDLPFMTFSEKWSLDTTKGDENTIYLLPVYESKQTFDVIIDNAEPKAYGFNEYVELNDETAVGWKVNDTLVATGTKFGFYVVGNMKIDKVTETATQPSSKIVKAVDNANDVTSVSAILPNGVSYDRIGFLVANSKVENQYIELTSNQVMNIEVYSITRTNQVVINVKTSAFTGMKVRLYAVVGSNISYSDIVTL